MKRWLYSVLCVGVMILLSPLAAFAADVPGGQLPVYGLAVEKLATRSGPGTGYRETGTYLIENESETGLPDEFQSEPVALFSRAYDENGVCWLQCEVSYQDKPRRVYTGFKRLDGLSFNLDSIPEEDPEKAYEASVTETSDALYGPGEGYDTYDELTVDVGQTVTVIATEGEYTQVEWTTEAQSYRAWVPTQALGI